MRSPKLEFPLIATAITGGGGKLPDTYFSFEDEG